MPDRCEAELCPNWTGQGCICAVMGIEPATRRCPCCAGLAVGSWDDLCERCAVAAVEGRDTEDHGCERGGDRDE